MAGNKKLIGERKAEAYQMLHSICKLLDQEGIEYVLEAGTLLGIVRENRLLPWDNDIDITVSATDVDKLLTIKKLIYKLGYKSKLRTYKWDVGQIKKSSPRILKIQTRKFLFFKKDSLMDIFIKYKIGEEYIWIVDDKRPVLKKTPAKFYDEKTRYAFDGAYFSVPKDYIGYLAYHYGKDWKTPIKNWDFRLDDACEKEEITIPLK